jgi:hypothetical protein
VSVWKSLTTSKTPGPRPCGHTEKTGLIDMQPLGHASGGCCSVRFSADRSVALSTAIPGCSVATPRETWRSGQSHPSFLVPDFGRGHSTTTARGKSEIPSRKGCTGSSPPRTLLHDAKSLRATDNVPARIPSSLLSCLESIREPDCLSRMLLAIISTVFLCS